MKNVFERSTGGISTGGQRNLAGRRRSVPRTEQQAASLEETAAALEENHRDGQKDGLEHQAKPVPA